MEKDIDFKQIKHFKKIKIIYLNGHGSLIDLHIDFRLWYFLMCKSCMPFDKISYPWVIFHTTIKGSLKMRDCGDSGLFEFYLNLYIKRI